MVNRIVLNETSYFGRGSRFKLGEELLSRGYNKVLLVTDNNLLQAGLVDKIIAVLNAHRILSVLFYNIKPNPTVSNVQEGLELAQRSGIDAIVAVGGGSVIDTAKAISIILTNPEYSNVTSLNGVVNTRNKGCPLFALPTTAGTAAEVTINYVITDEENHRKMVCVDVHDIPVCSIIDPDLMDEMPQFLAATTGMDALTHAMEGYITKAAWLMTDMFHLNAMALIYKNLENAAMNKDSSAIEKMAYAQYMAGMGFSNVGLGIVHSMAHALGAYFDVPHGLANAILLPYVMRFNGQACPELFINMAHALDLEITEDKEEEAVEIVVEAIKNLSKKLRIPQCLKEIGIPRESFLTLSKCALNDICTGGNPIDVTLEDIKFLFEEAYEKEEETC